jgi:hypothetical protein
MPRRHDVMEFSEESFTHCDCEVQKLGFSGELGTSLLQAARPKNADAN